MMASVSPADRGNITEWGCASCNTAQTWSAVRSSCNGNRSGAPPSSVRCAWARRRKPDDRKANVGKHESNGRILTLPRGFSPSPTTKEWERGGEREFRRGRARIQPKPSALVGEGGGRPP